MTWSFPAFSLIFLAGGILAGAFCAVALARRGTPGAVAFSGLMLAIAIWMFGRFLEAGAEGLAWKVIWANVEWIGIATAPALALWFALDYSGVRGWQNWRNMLLLWVIPAITLPMVWTNDLHHLHWSFITWSPGAEGMVALYERGPWFWASTVYAYATLIASSVLIMRVELRGPVVYRYRIVLLSIATAVPVAANLVYLSGYSPLRGLDLTPFAFTFGAILYTVVLFRYRFLESVPVARDTLFESMSDGIIVIDRANRIVDMNNAGARLAGLAWPDSLGKILERDWAPLGGTSGSIFANSESELRVETSHGTAHLEIRLTPYDTGRGGEGGRLLVLRDVTERIRAQEALRTSEGRYRRLVEMAADAVVSWDAEGRITAWNPAANRLFKHTEAYMLGKSYQTIIPEHIRAEVITHLASAVARGDLDLDGRPFETAGLCGDGSEFPAEVALTTQASPAGLVFTAIIRDITLRKRQEEQRRAEEIRESEEEKQAILNGLHGIIVQYLNRDLRILWANRALARAFNLPDDPVGEACYRIMQNRETPCPGCVALKAFATGQPHEGEVVVPDGRVWMVRSHPLLDQQKVRGVIYTAVDITERSRLEEARQNAEKLESVGLLAGGIAHDFNNILTSMMVNLGLAREDAPPGSELLELLVETETNCQKAAGLTQQLLTFARGGDPARRATSLAEIIEGMVRFTLRGSAVKPEVSIDPDLWPAEVDSGQVGRVFGNIMLNAREALARGGVVRVTAVNCRVREGEILGLASGRYVTVRFQDNGPGIAPEDLRKIFQPYFSTKQRGSGLGLATAFSIVKRHGGIILAESEKGQGATFSVYLPASEKAVEKTVYVGVAQVPTALKARVLVMDDEEQVRRAACTALKRFGCEVEETQDGRQAVEVYRRARGEGKPFSAVILDLTVPGGMGGLEAIAELKKIDPLARVIVSSGYSNDDVLQNFARYGFHAVVPKPYAPQELEEALVRVLKVP